MRGSHLTMELSVEGGARTPEPSSPTTRHEATNAKECLRVKGKLGGQALPRRSNDAVARLL